VSAGNHSEYSEFGVTLNWQRTDGYAPRVDSDIERGYDNLSANLYAARRFGDNEFSFRHWQTEGNVEYLDFFLAPVDQDFRTTTTAAQLDNKWSDKGVSKFIASFMQDDITQQQSDDFVRSERISLDWQYSHSLASHTVTAGLYAIDEVAESLSWGSGFDEDTAVRAAFLQDQWSKGRHRSFLALRFTDHETFGNHTTWNAEYAFDVNDAWTLTAGIGHAFRAPDATDRFGFGGSPDLLPELADEAQFGLRFSPGTRHRFDIELYRNDIDDLIEFDLQSFTLQNIAAAEIRGAQIAYEYRGEKLVFRAEAVTQKTDNADTGERLLRRAEKSASLSLTRNIGEHRVGLSVFASGEREDFGGVRLDGYVLTDLAAQFRLSNTWVLHIRIHNLLDKEYQTAADFRMPERSGFVELKYRWD
jgi:vitamin B12 transporter